MVALANLHAVLKNQEVAIVVIDDMLFAQTSLYVEQFCDSRVVQVFDIKMLTREDVTDKLVIIDEFDLVIEKYAAIFETEGKVTHVKGLPVV